MKVILHAGLAGLLMAAAGCTGHTAGDGAGGAPSLAQGTPATVAAERVDDLDCAAAYLAAATRTPANADDAAARMDRAIQSYRDNPPPATSGPTPVTDGEIEAEIRARSDGMLRGAVPSLSAAIRACDAQYGLPPLSMR